jgi:hypothetical protein
MNGDAEFPTYIYSKLFALNKNIWDGLAFVRFNE